MHRARGARRGPGAAAVLAAVLAAGPALAWSPAPAAAARPGPAALAPPLGTSVLSVRRLPGWLQATVASQQLTRALAAVTSAGSLGAAATTTCLEVDQGSSVLFELHPEMELVPASNLKLFTAVAAMAELGPDYHFTTSVEATAAPAGGIVTGDLFLVGGGDPLLRTPDFVNGLPNATPLYTSFTQLAAEVHAAGVTEITGGVVGDEGRYDSLRNVASWKPIYQAEGDVGPLSALDVDDGLIPANKAVTPAAPPPVQSAELMASLLGAEGVKVDGAAGAAPAPAGSVAIASVVSPPLSSELAEILRESDDTAAELVTKELGYHAGTGGSTAAGTAMVRSVLAAHGLPVGQLVDSDGSGLSTDDRATCELIDRTLDLGGPAGALARDLPVAAVSGTLHARLVGTPAAGRVTAKSGNLDGVDALSGYVQPATGAGAPTGPMAAALTFSFVVNNIATASAGDSAEDNLALSLAGYPHLLPLALLSPAPPR